MNMLFQKSVIPRPTEPTPEGRGFVPRHFEDDHNYGDYEGRSAPAEKEKA
jgi:hypothetical protein